MKEILETLPEDVNAKELLKLLGDHKYAPSCLCVHDPEFGKTCAAIVVALHEKKAWIAWGNPCEDVFEEISLNK